MPAAATAPDSDLPVLAAVRTKVLRDIPASVIQRTGGSLSSRVKINAPANLIASLAKVGGTIGQ